MLDFQLVEYNDTEHYLFPTSIFYALSKKGVNIYFLEHAGPKLTCSTKMLDGKTMNDLPIYSTFDYDMTFFESNCIEKNEMAIPSAD